MVTGLQQSHFGTIGWTCSKYFWPLVIVWFVVLSILSKLSILLSSIFFELSWLPFGDPLIVVVGSVTQIQLPVRQIQNITYSYSLKKRFRCRCFRFLTHLHVNVTSSEIKASRKLLKSFISGDEYPSTTPKDDHPGSNQSDICKNLNAFYQFSRPHTVIGTVSMFCQSCWEKNNRLRLDGCNLQFRRFCTQELIFSFWCFKISHLSEIFLRIY